MKKIISIILIVTMLFAVMAPMAFASDAKVKDELPMIFIRGNGEDLYDENGKLIPGEIGDLFDKNIVPEEEGITKEELIESCVNILLPFLAEGLLTDNWDDYGKAIYEEISPLFEKTALDGNGNPKYGTGVSKKVLAKSEYNAANVDFKETDGRYFLLNQYDFCYDWRLSPYDHVDRLHEYIKTIIKTTGSEGVCIGARCLGGNLLHAYLDKYGKEGLVKRVFYGEVLANGSAYISQCFSGKFAFDAKHMQMYLSYAEENALIGFTDLVSEIVAKSMDLFVQVGVVDTVFGGIEELYGKLYQALIPALLLSTGMATMPNYWACVYEEDMPEALDLIFGKEGSERRKEYAGAIEKIQLYRKNISSDLKGFYKRISEDYKIEVGVLAKYGYLSMPIIEDYDELSDSLIGLKDASFGATCSTVTTTLSDEHINSRIAENPDNAKYISPDKMVDVSTCYFPETTWIVKNSIHALETIFTELGSHFLSHKNLTIENDNRVARFSVYAWSGGNAANCYVKPLTETNGGGFEWIDSVEEKPTTETKLAAFMRFFTVIFDFIARLFRGEISFGNKA